VDEVATQCHLRATSTPAAGRCQDQGMEILSSRILLRPADHPLRRDQR
jgi:hypothetical protein